MNTKRTEGTAKARGTHVMAKDALGNLLQEPKIMFTGPTAVVGTFSNLFFWKAETASVNQFRPAFH